MRVYIVILNRDCILGIYIIWFYNAELRFVEIYDGISKHSIQIIFFIIRFVTYLYLLRYNLIIPQNSAYIWPKVNNAFIKDDTWLKRCTKYICK